MLRFAFLLPIVLFVSPSLVMAQDADDIATETAETAEAVAENPEAEAAAASDQVDLELTQEAGSGAAAEEPPPSDADEVALHDEQVLIEEEHSKSLERRKTDPYEDPARNYLFLGIGYHHHFTPRFITGLFTDEQTLASNPNISLEFTKRKGNFEMVFSVAYQSFHVNGPFRGKGQPEGETEFIDSSLKSIMVGATFLWGTQFNDYIGIQYGFGLGVGGVFGDLVRTEAQPGSGPDSVRDWERCEGLGGSFCDQVDSDFPGQTSVNAANWFNGGSVPSIWLRAAVPHIALRIKPIHQLVIRIDTGFDIFSGFFVGGTVSFGF